MVVHKPSAARSWCWLRCSEEERGLGKEEIKKFRRMEITNSRTFHKIPMQMHLSRIGHFSSFSSMNLVRCAFFAHVIALRSVVSTSARCRVFDQKTTLSIGSIQLMILCFFLTRCGWSHGIMASRRPFHAGLFSRFGRPFPGTCRGKPESDLRCVEALRQSFLVLQLPLFV